MSPQSIELLLALALGFAVAGLCSSAYRLVTARLPSFALLNGGVRVSAFAAIPLLIVTAPFLIMRNTLLSDSDENRFQFVFMATLVAGFWSLMSGQLFVMALQAGGFFAA